MNAWQMETNDRPSNNTSIKWVAKYGPIQKSASLLRVQEILVIEDKGNRHPIKVTLDISTDVAQTWRHDGSQWIEVHTLPKWYVRKAYEISEGWDSHVRAEQLANLLLNLVMEVTAEVLGFGWPSVDADIKRQLKRGLG